MFTQRIIMAMVAQENGGVVVVIMIAFSFLFWLYDQFWLSGRVDDNGPLEREGERPEFEMSAPIAGVFHPLHVLLEVGDGVGELTEGPELVLVVPEGRRAESTDVCKMDVGIGMTVVAVVVVVVVLVLRTTTLSGDGPVEAVAVGGYFADGEVLGCELYHEVFQFGVPHGRAGLGGFLF
mmetsp:Transcript_12415/g.17823  ORF Transcript_12415/g.17823 Transcript_12415/m.17823 type:complete len:179 (+) Transcript_12415:279-815(+)